MKTRTFDGKRWVLDLVKRADFPDRSVTTVDGWELLYQPELRDQLHDSELDFQDNQIIVRPIATRE